MTFVKGLLLCMDCELFPTSVPWSTSSKLLFAKETMEKDLVSGCSQLVEQTPIDLLSRLLLKIDNQALAERIFKSYDRFLALVGDEKKRGHLEGLTFDNACTDAVFEDVRDIGKIFADSLETLFFGSYGKLSEITQKYGVF